MTYRTAAFRDGRVAELVFLVAFVCLRVGWVDFFALFGGHFGLVVDYFDVDVEGSLRHLETDVAGELRRCTLFGGQAAD